MLQNGKCKTLIRTVQIGNQLGRAKWERFDGSQTLSAIRFKSVWISSYFFSIKWMQIQITQARSRLLNWEFVRHAEASSGNVICDGGWIKVLNYKLSDLWADFDDQILNAYIVYMYEELHRTTQQYFTEHFKDNHSWKKTAGYNTHWT